MFSAQPRWPTTATTIVGSATVTTARRAARFRRSSRPGLCRHPRTLSEMGAFETILAGVAVSGAALLIGQRVRREGNFGERAGRLSGRARGDTRSVVGALRGRPPMARSLLASKLVPETQLQKQLLDMHDRMERIIGELNVLRAKVAEATEDIEKGAAFSRLRADGVWEP